MDEKINQTIQVSSASESFYSPAVALTGQHRGFPEKLQLEQSSLKQKKKNIT